MVGKAIAGGIPTAVWGMSAEVADRLTRARASQPDGRSGMGTTLSGTALQLAALRATLENVATEAAYVHMNQLADRLEAGLADVLAQARLPWHVARCGARVEVVRAPHPLINGSESHAAHFADLEATIHLALLVRGVLISPFHDMMLCSPATGEEQVERLIAATRDVVRRLTA